MLLWALILAFVVPALWSYSVFYYESSQNGHLAGLKAGLGLLFWPVFLLCVLKGALSMALAAMLFPTTLVPWLWRANDSKYKGIPVIFVHGYLHNRTGWLFYRWLFKRSGLGPTYAYTFRGTVKDQAERLARIVDEVIGATGAPRLDLVGHSMGGLVIRRYLAGAGGERVRRVVTLGSPHRGSKLAAFAPTRAGRELLPESALIKELKEMVAPPGGVELYSLYTPFDNMVLPVRSSVLEGASISTIALGPTSHVGILYSFRAAKKVIELLKQ